LEEAAATTLEWQGQKFYFVGAETRREFAEQNKIAIAKVATADEPG
jgi:hypothetical protein